MHSLKSYGAIELDGGEEDARQPAQASAMYTLGASMHLRPGRPRNTSTRPIRLCHSASENSSNRYLESTEPGTVCKKTI